MKRRIWPLFPILISLLACKAGETLAPEREQPAEPAVPAAATPVSARKAPAKGRVPLTLIEGKARTEHGFIVIPGEVKNDTGKWLKAVHVTVELLDAAGKPIPVSSIAGAEGRPEGVVASRTVVPPGEVAVFRYTRDMKKLARPYASHRLQADGRIADDTMTASVGKIADDKDKLDFHRVSGRLTSTGSAGCRSPQAVIGLYAADGKLWDVKTAYVDAWFQKVMPKGESADFERRAIDGRSGVFQRVEVWGDCRL
jgi:hypothetical protein